MQKVKVEEYSNFLCLLSDIFSYGKLQEDLKNKNKRHEKGKMKKFHFPRPLCRTRQCEKKKRKRQFRLFHNNRG